MRNSLLLIMLGTTMAFGTSSPLRAQAPPAATKPNATNEAAAWGILDSPVVFEWKSGYLSSFLGLIKAVFGIDLNQRADIPEQMLRVRVPSMKIKTASVWEVLDLYNSISEDHPESGKWVVKHARNNRVLGEFGLLISEPNAVFLVPSNQTNTEDILLVRAFTLRDLHRPEWKRLLELIKVEGDRLRNLEVERGIKPSLLRGDIHVHEDTGICVATGGKTYVEMVGSLVEAFREGRRIPAPPARPDSPKPQDDK